MGVAIQKLSSNKNTTTNSFSSTSSSNSNSPSSTTKTSTTKYTTDQIATHSTKNDCWLIIDGGVYDVSQYLNQHPGGVAQVIPFCGKDATQAFKTRGGKGTHSESANTIKQEYQIGTVQN